MSTGPKNAKRARTIDAFFAPKLQPKHVSGVEPPRQNVGTACVKGSGDVDAGTTEPLAAQPNQAEGAAAASSNPVVAAEVDTAPQNTPRRSGRKRRSRGDSPTPPEPGAADAVEADASAVAAEQQPDEAQEQQQQQQEHQGDAGQGQAQQADAPERTPSPPAEDDLSLTAVQRAEIAARRNKALARRAVSAASAPGAPPLQLSALLVEESWREALQDQLKDAANTPLRQLEPFLHTEWKAGRKPVYPPQESIFQAFNACPFDKVRVVILGQDPYHGPGQAMGLSFSVPRDVKHLPPSLINIYKEAATDLGWEDKPRHGDLSSWSVQGVLLLNTCLTVRQGDANSHSKKGWEQFTDAAIRVLSSRRTGLVFLLWGNPAQAKAQLIDTRKHHVLRAAHPSPLSASRGFFGCRHFSKANELLAAQGLPPIDWMPK